MNGYRIERHQMIYHLYHQGRLIACSYWRDNVARVAREHERKSQLMHTSGGR